MNTQENKVGQGNFTAESYEFTVPVWRDGDPDIKNSPAKITNGGLKFLLDSIGDLQKQVSQLQEQLNMHRNR